MDPDLGGQALRLVDFGHGDGGGDAGHCEGARAEDIGGDRGHERRVHAAGEGDDG